MSPSPSEAVFSTGSPTTVAEMCDTLGALIAKGHARFTNLAAGRFSPATEPAPADTEARRAEILAAWAPDTIDRANTITQWPAAALVRYHLPHPVLGMLAVQDMLAFTTYQTAHHLSRIMERSAHD